MNVSLAMRPQIKAADAKQRSFCIGCTFKNPPFFFVQNLRLYREKMGTYLFFKVLAIANHYFFPSFWQFINIIWKTLFRFLIFSFIDLFRDIFIRTEVLLSECERHRWKQMVIERYHVWGVQRGYGGEGASTAIAEIVSLTDFRRV